MGRPRKNAPRSLVGEAYKEVQRRIDQALSRDHLTSFVGLCALARMDDYGKQTEVANAITQAFAAARTRHSFYVDLVQKNRTGLRFDTMQPPPRVKREWTAAWGN